MIHPCYLPFACSLPWASFYNLQTPIVWLKSDFVRRLQGFVWINAKLLNFLLVTDDDTIWLKILIMSFLISSTHIFLIKKGNILNGFLKKYLLIQFRFLKFFPKKIKYK